MVRFQVKSDGSPNWPASTGDNGGLRGSKTTLFEGGVRGTAFLAGGALPSALAGTVYHGLTHVVDFTATIAAAAGVSVDGDVYDIVGAATGATKNRTVVPINILDGGANYSAIRFGNWKLIVGGGTTPVSVLPGADKANGWFKNGAYPPSEGPPAGENPALYLFDIFSDPTEHHDLSAAHPDVVSQGKALIAKFVAAGYEEPQNNAPAAAALPQLHGGTWSPFHETIGCATGLETACGQHRGGGAPCQQCLADNAKALRAAGCTVVSEAETKYCQV